MDHSWDWSWSFLKNHPDFLDPSSLQVCNSWYSFKQYSFKSLNRLKSALLNSKTVILLFASVFPLRILHATILRSLSLVTTHHFFLVCKGSCTADYQSPASGSCHCCTLERILLYCFVPCSVAHPAQLEMFLSPTACEHEDSSRYMKALSTSFSWANIHHIIHIGPSAISNPYALSWLIHNKTSLCAPPTFSHKGQVPHVTVLVCSS